MEGVSLLEILIWEGASLLEILIWEGVSLLEILIWEGVSLLEILIWIHYKGMWIKNLPYMYYYSIRIEIIYGKGKFVGDFNMVNIICVKFLPRAYG